MSADLPGVRDGEYRDDGQFYHSFNGGKMEHIFRMEPIGKHNKMQYVDEFSSDVAREAFEQSENMYWKIDGSCAILDYDAEQDKIYLYHRQDTRGKDPGPTLTALPKGKNPSSYTSHSYYMEKLAPREQDGKKQAKNKRMLLDLLDRHKDTLKQLILKHKSSTAADEKEEDADAPIEGLSVEVVGTKYQRTPGVKVPVAIAPHCSQQILTSDVESLPRSFDQAKGFLLRDHVAEGIVVEYKDCFYKVVSHLFDVECTFTTDKAQVMPPVIFYE